MNARIRTIGPDHPDHPIQVTARRYEADWLRSVQQAGTWELLQMRGAHRRVVGEHDADACWKCIALTRASERKK